MSASEAVLKQREKNREYARKHRAKNPEKRREQDRARYIANLDRNRKRMQAYYQTNKEKYKARGREYYRRNAKKCMAWTTLWRKNNPEKMLAYKAAYRAKNREWLRGQHWKRRFGLTREDHANLLKKQKGVCAICKGTDKGKRLSVDHRHNTKIVRGLLCSLCNSGLGAFHENLTHMRQAIKYLSKHKRLDA